MTTAKKKTRKTAELEALLGRFLQAREEGRRSFQLAEETLDLILKVASTGDIIHDISGDRQYEIVDNFEKTNVSFRSARVLRFELKEIKHSK